MVGDTVLSEGRALTVIWDGAIPPRAPVTTLARLSTDRRCACGCGLWVSPPAWYASQACAGRAHRGKSMSERMRRTG